MAFWNGKDSMLKERLFGVTGHQGNHGEDVKEVYYYLDSTPTHSYMKYLYKYPQAEFPYEKLVSENQCRSREEPEYELMDTGIFDEDRYWDINIEVRFLNMNVRQPHSHFDVVCERGGYARSDICQGDGIQQRARSGDSSYAANSLVPEHLVMDQPTAREAESDRSRRQHHRRFTQRSSKDEFVLLAFSSTNWTRRRG